MSQVAIGQTVLVPATVKKVTEDKTGTYVEVEIVANNTTKILSLEDNNLVIIPTDESKDGE